MAARRVDALRRMPFATLEALPERQEDEEGSGDRKMAVAVYRDRLDDGRLQVVVQVYRHWLLGIGHIAAEGFIMDPGGRLTPIPPERMWEFL